MPPRRITPSEKKETMWLDGGGGSTRSSLPSRGGAVKNALPMFASVGLALPTHMDKIEEFVKSKVAAAGSSLRQRALRSPLFFARASASVVASATAPVSTVTVSRIADFSSAQEAHFKLNKTKSKLRPASEAELEAAFHRVDKNQSGDIDREELQAACAALVRETERGGVLKIQHERLDCRVFILHYPGCCAFELPVAPGLPSSDDYVDEVMQMYDGNGDRTVDKKEFIGFIRKREQALWTAFQTLDLDKNGVLTPDEALKAVRKLGLKADERDASQMIKMLDANNDGVVSFDEFRAYLALLPAAQLRENVGWNWLAAASDRQVEMPSNQPFKQLLSGALGGALSRTLVAPLDRAVTMMQADSGKLKLTAAFKDVVSKEGIGGLWRGNVPNVVKVIPRSALQFAVFANMKDFFLLRHTPNPDGSSPGGLSVAERLAAGSVAGAVATVVTYPLDLLRCQMQLNGGGFASTFNAVMKTSGPAGLYKGLTPTLGADVVGNGLGFFLYDTYVEKYKEIFGKKAGSIERGVIGGLTGCTCLTITFPLEVVMTRMRVQGTGGRPVLYKNAIDCMAQIARAEGIGALYKGAVATYAKVLPQVFVVYFTVSAVNKALGVGGLRAYDAK